MRTKQEGFAIIQVVIAATIFSFLALAMGSLITEQKKSITYMEDQLEKIQLIRNFETILRDGLSCQKTLKDIKVNRSKKIKVAITGLKDNSGKTIYKSNSSVGNLLTGQIYIKNLSIPGPTSSGFIQVFMPLERKRHGGGPKALRPLEFTLMVTVDGGSKVTDCSTAGTTNVTLRESRTTDTCTCNSDEVRTGCSGIQPSGFDIYAVPNGCKGQRVDLIQCFCMAK